MKLSFMETSRMTPGIFQSEVWEKNIEPKKTVFSMFLNPKILQRLFPYPNLNILKIWAGNMGKCKSYEGHCTPYPLHNPIVQHGRILFVFQGNLVGL